MLFDRREFLGSAIAAATLVLPGRVAGRALPPPLRLALLTNGDALEAALLGVRFGAEEAAQTMALLGAEARLLERRLQADAHAAALAAELRDAGVTAIVSLLAAPAETARALRDHGLDALWLDARALRPGEPQDCDPLVFHTGIDARTRDAVAAAPAGDARPVGTAEAAPRRGVHLWHPSLHRYGATQLNDRFRRRFERGMHGHSWAGWMSAKVLMEAHLRARATDAAAMAAYLTGRRARFDGHKGESLRFREADRQLLQPLYRIETDDILQFTMPPAEGGHGC